MYDSCESVDASCDELYNSNSFVCVEDKRQFLSFWYEKWSHIAKQVNDDLEDGIEKMITEYAIRVRKSWFDLQLAKTLTSHQDTVSKANDELISYILNSGNKTLVKYYKNMITHITAMFASDKTSSSIKKKICTQLTTLIDIDPSIIEILWPTIGQYLQKDPSVLTGSDSMMDCLTMVVHKIDRFDSYMQGSKSQATLPSGRVESIVKKIINLVLRILEKSPSGSLVKRCLKLLRLTSAHHSITSGINIRIITQLIALAKKGIFKEECSSDASLLFIALLSGSNETDSSNTDPDIIAKTADTLIDVVESEINNGPLFLFDTTAVSHKPNPLMNVFSLLLQKGDYATLISPIASHLLSVSSLPTLHLLLKCTLGRDDALWRTHYQLQYKTLIKYVTDVQSTSSTESVGDNDEKVSQFFHSTHILMLLTSPKKSSSKSNKKSKNDDYKIPPTAVSPFLQLLSYCGKNSQLVIVNSIKFLAHISYCKERCVVRQEALLSFYDFFNKTYNTVTNAYLKAFVQRKDDASIQQQILPHVLRGMFILCEIVGSMEWVRTVVQKVLRSERKDDVLIKPPANGTTPRNGAILANIYQNVLCVVVNYTRNEKAIAVALRLTGSLCRHDGKTYFPASQKIIAIAMRDEGGNPEPKIAAIELIRDFLVDEEDKIEKALNHQQSSIESSPGAGNSQDSGIAASILQTYLPGILLCLGEPNLYLRSLAMDVVDVCYHQGLSSPAISIEHIICSSADNQISISDSATSLLQKFASKGWSGTIASKAACGVLKSFILHLRMALTSKQPSTPLDWSTKQSNINEIKGTKTANTGIIQSIHLPMYESAFSSVQRGKGGSKSLATARGKAKDAGQSTAVLALVRLLTGAEKRDDWRKKIEKVCPYAALQFPRYVAEVLCAIPFTRYNHVLDCVEAIESGIAVTVEECTEQLRLLMPDDTKKPKPSGKRTASGNNLNKENIIPKGQTTNHTSKTPYEVVVDVLSVVTLYQLSLFLRADYDITKRKTRDEPVKSVLQTSSETVKNFFTNTDIVDACCNTNEDGTVVFTTENYSDLAETLGSVQISLAEPVKRKKPPTKGGKTKRRRRRGSSTSSSSSTSSDSESSSESESSSSTDPSSDAESDASHQGKRKAASKRPTKKRK